MSVEIHDRIFDWWANNKLEYPWRNTPNPYHVLVSEFMLQQTQATRVIPKFTAFVKKFPTLDALAESSQSEVLRLWSGLGYNRRAVQLQNAAQTLLDWGHFPDDPQELIKLKGIGPYSSRSIPIFAFNKDIGTVDTNIRRVFITEGFATDETSQKDLFRIADELVPHGRSRDWHNALMDYGSKVVSARKTGIRSTSRQGDYKGSTRYFRGKIVKILLEGPETLNELCRLLGVEQATLHPILKKLERERIVTNDNNVYSLP